MYWSLLAAAVALAIGYYQVGAMSVWVTVLSFTLKGVLLVIAIGAVVLSAIALRRRFTR